MAVAPNRAHTRQGTDYCCKVMTIRISIVGFVTSLMLISVSVAGQNRTNVTVTIMEAWAGSATLKLLNTGEVRTNLLNIHCVAVVNNLTGAAISWESTYSSPVSWLFLTVREPDGDVIIRRSVVWHHSGYSAVPLPFVLPVGRTTNVLANPELSLGAARHAGTNTYYNVSLDGYIPGTKQSITSNIVKVSVLQ